MQEQGADIGKIVTTAKDYVDVLHVLSLQEKAAELDFPLIAFCMGTPRSDKPPGYYTAWRIYDLLCPGWIYRNGGWPDQL